MGRHSNLLLLDEQRRIIALGRQVRDHQSRVRPLSTGDSYSPPPMLQGLAPDPTEGFERWKERLSLLPIPLRKALQQTYQGISPALALQLAGDHLNTPVDSLDALHPGETPRLGNDRRSPPPGRTAHARACLLYTSPSPRD